MSRSWRIRRAVAGLALLGLLFLPGCGSGPSSPTSPAAPGMPGPGTGGGQPAGTITRGPYLQHADSGVTVVWYTDAPTEGHVRWSAGEDRSGEADSSSGVASRHEAVIPPLPPGERCTYQVYSSRGLLTGHGDAAEFSFRAPAADVLRLVVFGDGGTGSPEQAAVARAIRAEAVAPDLVMIAGDVNQIPDGTTDYDSRFFAPYRELLPAVPFYALMGNHDYEEERGKALLDVFTLPRNGPPGLVPETAYWMEHAGALMIVHDTNQTPATLRDQAVPWHAQVARRPATFRLAFQHHTFYGSGPNAGSMPGARSALAPLYASTGVDVVFNGHDHLYERTRPINGVVYVTTGAGGGTLYPRVETNAFTAAFFNDRHSYTHVEIKGRTLLLRQTDVDGRGVDALAITKPVAAADALSAFAGAGEPPRGWTEPGFDDAAWGAVGRAGYATAVRARRGFDLVRPGEVGEAVLRVRGARDFVVRLNGAEVARGDGRGEAEAAFPVATSLLRPGRNALSLEGWVDGTEGSAPALDLSLFSSPPR